MADNSAHRSWARRLGWMVLLWTTSVAVLGLVALIIRLLLRSAGMTA